MRCIAARAVVAQCTHRYLAHCRLRPCHSCRYRHNRQARGKQHRNHEPNHAHELHCGNGARKVNSNLRAALTCRPSHGLLRSEAVMGMMNDGMMWGMGFGHLLLLVLGVLAGAALVKYLFFR